MESEAGLFLIEAVGDLLAVASAHYLVGWEDLEEG